MMFTEGASVRVATDYYGDVLEGQEGQIVKVGGMYVQVGGLMSSKGEVVTRTFKRDELLELEVEA